jgi:hypothetical protein
LRRGQDGLIGAWRKKFRVWKRLVYVASGSNGADKAFIGDFTGSTWSKTKLR